MSAPLPSTFLSVMSYTHTNYSATSAEAALLEIKEINK
jgi:hypothetical protein